MPETQHDDTASEDSLILTPAASGDNLRQMDSPESSTSSAIPAGASVQFTPEAATFIHKNFKQQGAALQQQAQQIADLNTRLAQSTGRLDNLVSTLSWVAGLSVAGAAVKAVNQSPLTGALAGFAYLAAMSAGVAAHDLTKAAVGTDNPVFGSYQVNQAKKPAPAPFMQSFIRNLSPPIP